MLKERKAKSPHDAKAGSSGLAGGHCVTQNPLCRRLGAAWVPDTAETKLQLHLSRVSKDSTIKVR